MLTLNYFTLILILLIIQLTFTQYNDPRPFRRQRSILQNLQQNQCAYGNGVINNSTVIELGNCFNDFYFITLNIGTQPQLFEFQFDTGSPTLWIPLGTYPTGFNQSKSSTYSITNQSASITYADNTGVSGNMGYDIVSVSGTPIKSSGSILFATQSNATFGNTSVYGLVGMDITSSPNFLDNAYSTGQISTSVFALDLNYVNQTSYLYYNNGLNQSILSQTTWISQYGSDHWEAQVIGCSANGFDFTSQASDTVVIDSGTSLLVFNPNLYNSFIQQFFSTSQCFTDNSSYVNCYCNSTWPSIAFMLIGGQVYIPGGAYQNSVGNGYCQVLIQTLSTVSEIILGDIFMRGYTISFDRGNDRIGFYGHITPMYVFDKQYFNIIQYILCGLGLVLTSAGIGMWLYDRSQLQKNAQRSLGSQLVSYR